MKNDVALQIMKSLRFLMETHPLIPYDDGSKHWRNPDKPHMISVMFANDGNYGITPLGSGYMFVIGNEEAEEKAPQYHILEDAKIIRFPNKGTKISKGSQANIKDKAKRNYGGYITRDGQQKTKLGELETFQEYRQNMSRNFFGANEKAREYGERLKYHHKNNRNYRYNDHWQYIERILEDIVPQIALEIGAKLVVGEEDLFDVATENETIYWRYKGIEDGEHDTMFVDVATGEIL